MVLHTTLGLATLLLVGEVDHVEPGVSTLLDQKDRNSPQIEVIIFMPVLEMKQRLLQGDAKGAKGVVTGHHGGAEHILIDFSEDVLDKLTLDDKFLIKGFGQGLKLLDYPDVHVYNLDPNLLEKMNVVEKNGELHVPVVAVVPPFFNGIRDRFYNYGNWGGL